MARVKLNFPVKKPIFIAQIPLRITDMNYGNHMGNDVVLSIMHDARMQFLASLGYTELEIGGCGLIMADVMIAYRNEGHYGDVLSVELFTDEVGSRSFDFLYRLSTLRAPGQSLLIAEGKTGMVCYDYQSNKVCSLPEKFVAGLN
ncbi:acyl-CoA thioesterase [Taibaiella koreensis]|uniref:acyl-CoA thioesterase n=1 Tax=Taibaiella koreensis TaxID=1268548 RepID=UPI000E59F2A9|nr:thioesterase family protein [Taibaiella koreensis]